MHFGAYVRPEIISALRQLAADRGVSQGALIEQLVEAFEAIPIESSVRAAMDELCQRLQQHPSEVLKALIHEFRSRRGLNSASFAPGDGSG